MPSFKPETCEDVEDDEDEAPPAFDAGKIFIFVIEQNKKKKNQREIRKLSRLFEGFCQFHFASHWIKQIDMKSK
jgi:hypothetical protein